jgi:hypothetical protein
MLTFKKILGGTITKTVPGISKNLPGRFIFIMRANAVEENAFILKPCRPARGFCQYSAR